MLLGKDSAETLNEILRVNGIEGDYQTVIKNFYVAVIAQEKSGVYSFYNDPIVWSKTKDYPIYAGSSGQSTQLFGTGAIVVKPLNGEFTVPTDGGQNMKYIAVSREKEILKPSEGNGTKESPYILKSEEELNALREYPNANFKLGNDITINKITYFPVKQFRGILDGNGYKISNLKKSLISTNLGTVQNLNIVANVDDEFDSYYGTIVDINQGKIADCSVTGNINLNIINSNKILSAQVGGIVGKNEMAGIVERSYVDANMTVNLPSNHSFVGGAVGSNNGKFENCYSSGTLNVIQKCDDIYKLQVGGFAGEITYNSSTLGLSVTNIYTTMNTNVNATGSKLLKSIGLFSGSINTGITSNNVGNVYVLEQNGQNATGNNHLITSDSLKTDSQMKTKETFAGFNFNGIWEMTENNYPKFVSSNNLVVTVENQRRDYYIGEKVELYFVKLDVNGAKVSVTEDMLNTYDTSSAGVKTITGKYRGQSFSFEINVKTPTNVTDLKIDKSPRLEYTENEVFDTSGLVLIATIDGNMYRRIYTGYTYDKIDPLKASDNLITFTYGTQTVTANLKVNKKAVKNVILLKSPDKINYFSGEKLNLEGLILQIEYTDGTKSPSFTEKELEKYNIKLAKGNSNTLSEIAYDESLSIEDNNINLYAFVDNVDENNTLNRRITTVKVIDSISFKQQNIVLTQNKDNYEFTENVEGGSGSYEVRLKSGTIPQNVTVKFNGSCFMIQGKPVNNQKSELIYEIVDKLTNQKLEAKINIVVQSVSTEANFYTFTILKALNPNLESDINAVITEDEVLIYVPKGTDVSKLVITHTESRGATLPEDRWNGAQIDFTNPVKFIITAEDGTTTKEYTVKAIVKENPNDNKIEIRKYKVYGDKISYIGQKVEIQEFLKNVIVSDNLKVEVEMSDKDKKYIGTNTKIIIKEKQTGEVVKAYECLIYGDINGDGKITSMDYTLIKNHIMDVKKITDKNMKLTADINGDGRITSMDYTLIKNDIMDVKKIVLK